MLLTSNLPDELLYTAFTYLDIAEQGRVARTSYRWREVSFLIRANAHSLKEKIVYDMITTDVNDLDYLVGLSTSVLKERKINQTAWSVLINVAREVVGHSSRNAIGVAWDTEWQRHWHAATDASIDAAWTVWCSALSVAILPPLSRTMIHTYINVHDAALSVADKAADDDAVIRYLHMWRDQEPAIRGKKAYQIAECLMLVSIDRKLCRAVQEITKDLPDRKIPEATLELLCYNPWAKQHRDLFS